VCKGWTTYRLIHAITHNRFDAVLDDPIKGLNGIDLCTLVQHNATTYAQISQPDLNDNLADFNTGIDPGLPLAVYTRKQERCQVFALDTAVPISKATMVTTGTKHSDACSNMTMAWREWNHCAIADHTWSNWKTHWMAAFAKMRNINCMTLSEAAFGANAAEEEHQACQIPTLLNNLANALIQKIVTIDNLVASNVQLTHAFQKMQAAMVRMFPTGQLHPATYQAPASHQLPAWLPNPMEAAAPPAALPAPTQVTKGPRPSYWGTGKLA
jgi:hypothetical protein